MTTLLAEFVPVASLQTGQVIRYHESDYVVAEVLPTAAPLSGRAVVAFAGGDLSKRTVLIYSNEGAPAELASGGEL